MALAAFLKASLTLLVKVLIGIAIVAVQWACTAVAGLLEMRHRYHGSNR